MGEPVLPRRVDADRSSEGDHDLRGVSHSHLAARDLGAQAAEQDRHYQQPRCATTTKYHSPGNCQDGEQVVQQDSCLLHVHATSDRKILAPRPGQSPDTRQSGGSDQGNPSQMVERIM